MNLKKHIFDTIKEWQLKIGYREGNMKLYYPGESLASLLGVAGDNASQETIMLENALSAFCDELEPQIGRIKISGTYERFCLDIPAKGCAYVAGKVGEPEFLKRFLAEITKPGNSMEQIRTCFAEYAREKGTSYVEEAVEAEDGHIPNHTEEHEHSGVAFYFESSAVEEYVYWVEENEFGLTYHRFTREEYRKLKE